MERLRSVIEGVLLWPVLVSESLSPIVTVLSFLMIVGQGCAMGWLDAHAIQNAHQPLWLGVLVLMIVLHTLFAVVALQPTSMFDGMAAIGWLVNQIPAFVTLVLVLVL